MAPFPFVQWRINILKPFPTEIYQKKFFIVTVEYFTKWPEEVAVATITQKSVEKFLFENIMWRLVAMTLS